MELVAVAAVAGAVLGVLLPRRMTSVSALAPPRSAGLLVIGLALETAGWRWPGDTGLALLLVGLAVLLAFAVRNRRLVGMVVVALGLALNLTVIALNRGMPVDGARLARPGPADADGFISAAPGATDFVFDLGPHRHLRRPDDRLVALSDSITVWHVDSVVSVGDLVIALGTAVVAGQLARQARFAVRRPLQPPSASAPPA
jgi:hypothetical protein